MKFNPEGAVANLLPEEWYDGLIIAAEDKVSKRDNAMLVVTIRVYSGHNPEIPSYFVDGNPSSLSRLQKLCRAVSVAFSKGEVTPDDLVNKNLRVLVKIQKDDTGQYGDKNVIAAFDLAKGTQIVPAGETPPATPDDDIPF